MQAVQLTLVEPALHIVVKRFMLAALACELRWAAKRNARELDLVFRIDTALSGKNGVEGDDMIHLADKVCTGGGEACGMRPEPASRGYKRVRVWVSMCAGEAGS